MAGHKGPASSRRAGTPVPGACLQPLRSRRASALRSQVPQAETNPSTFLAPRRVNRRWRGAPQSGRAAPPPRARRLRQRWPRRSAGLAPQNAAAEHAPVPRGHGAHRCLQRWMNRRLVRRNRYFIGSWRRSFAQDRDSSSGFLPLMHGADPSGAVDGMRRPAGVAEGCARLIRCTHAAATAQASGSLPLLPLAAAGLIAGRARSAETQSSVDFYCAIRLSFACRIAFNCF